MKVSIIGTGNVGGALTRALTRAGHDVVVTSTTPDEAHALASETGATAVGTSREAVDAADIVIAAVYFDAVGDVLADVGDAIDGKILVDVSNRVPVDGRPGAAVDGTSNAEQIQARATNARVVKAFNTVLAARQQDPQVGGIAADAHVAADDDEARRTVIDLVASAGFTPVDTGPLDSARILEAMGVFLIWQNLQGGSWQNAWKLLEPNATA